MSGSRLCGQELQDGRTCRRKVAAGKSCPARHSSKVEAATAPGHAVDQSPQGRQMMRFISLLARTDPFTGRVVAPVTLRRSGPFRRLWNAVTNR